MRLVDQIYKKVLTYLASNNFSNDIKIENVSKALDIDIHLLISNPKVKKLFDLNKNDISFYLDMTIREWLNYHFYYIHQGYRYNFPELQQKWLGKIIIKDPLDCWVQQELIYQTKPDIIIEIGVAFGGSAYYYATLLDLIKNEGKVIGIDITLNRLMDINHPRIEFIENSSIDEDFVDKLYERFKDKNVMVVLDSNHEKDHVLKEIQLYSKFIKKDNYLIVEDGIFGPLNLFPVPIDGPLEAIDEFIRNNDDFIIDKKIFEKYIITHCPNGYLRRIK